MLLGPHGSRIDVHVRVDFDGGDLEAGGLEEQTNARGDDALAHAGDDA